MTPEQRLLAFRKFVERSPDDAFARYSVAMGLRAAGHAEEAPAEFGELAVCPFCERVSAIAPTSKVH